MFVKILGVLDVFIAVCLWFFAVLGLVPSKFIFILGIILVVKGLIFILGLSIISFLDIVVGLIIIIASFINMPQFVMILLVLFLIQKGIFSLL